MCRSPLVLFLTLITLAAAASAAFAQEGGFEKEVVAASERYAADVEKAGSLAMEGDVDTANKQLLALTEKDKSPAVAFVVANTLYKMDPAASYDLHRRAYAANPGERATALEWAMERHRRGEYAEAVPLYRQFLGASKSADQYHALLAECLIRQGKLKEAVAAWEAAGHPHHHTAIDFAICEIHGDLSPLRRRSDLLRQLKKGEAQAAERLIALDLNTDQDWWNSRVNKDGLAHDLPLVEQALGKDSARLKEIRCWVDVASDDEPTAGAIAAKLKAAGLVVGDGRLPESSFVAGRLIGMVVRQKIEPAERLFGRFEKELTARAKSKAGDAEALNILCGLSVGDKTMDRLAEYDRYGWERYGDFRFALSLLAGLAGQGKLPADSPELKKALTAFPDNGVAYQIAIRSAGEKGVTKELLVDAIKAEYHKLSPALGGYPDSYTLKAYFGLLKQKL